MKRLLISTKLDDNLQEKQLNLYVFNDNLYSSNCVYKIYLAVIH
jgi:hypothetical protein